MKVSIKTLKGEQFQVEASPTDSISVVKEAIFAAKPEFQPDRQKLIHSGKVLKDNVTLAESGITEADFVVCMITKETVKAKPSVAAPAPTSTAAPVLPTAASPQTIPSIPPAALAPVPVAAPSPVPLNEEAVTQMLDMGFPETEVRAALQAANGNADLAVEFLMNGIPEHALNAMASQRTVAASGGAPSGGGGVTAHTGSIEQLRQHPQFDQLRLVVQQNPSELPRVLELIGQQDPSLLGVIHSNQERFLAMMNEPITNNPAARSPVMPPGFGAGGAGDPTQALQLLMALPPAQRNQAAQAMGISPDQLNSLTQLLNTMPADQLQRLMGAMGGPAGGAMGGPGAGMPPGGNVVRLTEEEMTSVNRLTELGFDQQDALAAYLACDKNEAMAANLLLEGWSSGEMGGGGDDGMYEGGPDDMYS